MSIGARRSREHTSAIRLILASASARRLALLHQIGYFPSVQAVDIDESPYPDEVPRALVRRLATRKAGAAWSLGVDDCRVVLAADTIIDLDGVALGKPRDHDDAVAMLRLLGAREHAVHTGLCLQRSRGAHAVCVTTRVRFGRISTADAERYQLSGESADKAGGYAIQGQGARFVASLAGSYSNVVGLPLHEAARLLEAAGLPADMHRHPPS